MTTTLHAHVSTSSRDCDSTYDREYVMTFNVDELREHLTSEGINDFSDIHFMERVVCSQISVYSHAGELTMSEYGFDWNETTEEGYSASEVRWCNDDCDEAVTSYRDHTAESMGY